jgi:motility quorum-sensing regulator/GCU-specific mRNA interferase toxin
MITAGEIRDTIFLMEKHTPHYNLADIQALIDQKGILTFTHTARVGFSGMGLSEAEALRVMLSLRKTMFYKSMTTYTDHHVWQDVYHAPTLIGKVAYIKITLRSNGTVVVQFKEK